MKLIEAIEEFLLAGRADGFSPSTAKWYRSLLIAFTHSLGGELEAISTRDIRNYIVALRERGERFVDAPQKPRQSGGLSESTIAGHITALHSFWAWAAREYGIANPMSNIKRAKRSSPQPKAIKAEDFTRLFAATGEDIAGVRDRALLVFLADSGVRLGGLVSLTLETLYLSERYAIVTEKGSKTRKVVFTYYTAQMLQKWLYMRPGNSRAVWVSLTHATPLTNSGVEQILKRLKKRAGVEGRTNPHSFRHNFAREYLRQGGELVTLAKLLGDSIEVTVDYYAVFSHDELAEMHEKFSPLKALRIEVQENAS